ncbi:MAG: YggS family pyridoxal phosphate-dependent enzyme [Oscillospiraceae bacterium]
MGIGENINEIYKKMKTAALKADRNIDDVKLVAVTKTKPINVISEAVNVGMTELGENRVQELLEKYDHVSNVNWHIIGHLQKNKVKYIIDKVALIHSVDSLELAKEINKRAMEINKVQDILIQVNISGEDSKFGIMASEVETLCRQISLLKNVKVLGLMTISVKDIGINGNKKIFSELKKLADSIKSLSIPNIAMEELSMGMTHDFDEAIEEGATIVRIGTGIFGER